MSADDLLVLMASYVLFVLSVVWLVAMLLTMYIGVSHLLYLKKRFKQVRIDKKVVSSEDISKKEGV